MTPKQCNALCDVYNTAAHDAWWADNREEARLLWAVAEIASTAATALLTLQLYQGAPGLYDAETSRYLGPAALEHCAAAAAATFEEEYDGIICLDGCGDVVERHFVEDDDGCWRSRRALPVRLVYVRTMCAE